MHIILEEVSKVTGVSKELIKSRIRMREAADARMLFCYMARKEGYLQREIGSFVGLCHSRVSAAYYDVKLGKGKFRPLIAKLSEGTEVSPENRKSMDVEDWIEDQSFVVVNPDLPVVGKSVALKAVRMAERQKPSGFFPPFWKAGCMAVMRTASLRNLKRNWAMRSRKKNKNRD